MPILSAYHKQTGEKANLALSRFPYSRQVVQLLKMQECIGEVHQLAYNPVMMLSTGKVEWRRYRFDLNDYMDTKGEAFLNLGFRHFPNKNYTEFIAEDHGLSIDWAFTLNIGDANRRYVHDVVVIDKYEGNPLMSAGIAGHYLTRRNDIVQNLQYAKGASAVKTYQTGAAILLLMSGINCTVYGEPRLRALHMNLIYNKTPGRATWVDL